MEQIKNEISRENANKILEDLKSQGLMSITEELIKDNKISFEIKGVKYRSRLLNLREKEELDALRIKKFGQLLQDKDLMLENTLIKVYKEKGIDIEEITEKIRKLDSEVHNIKLLLGEAISKNEGESIFKAYGEQISGILVERNILYVQKSTLLEYSIESQIINYVAELMTYLSTEMCTGTSPDEEKYVRVWVTFEDFKKCTDDELLNKAGVISTLLQYSI